jgi:hypothetical protein
MSSEQEKSTSALVYIGVIGLIVGAVWSVKTFNTNVLECGGFWAGTNLCDKSELIVNQKLLEKRNLHFAGAALLTICSLITTLFGTLQNRRASV